MSEIEGSSLPDNGTLLTAINNADINNYENSVISYKQFIDDTTDLLNNIGADPKSMELLDTEQRKLEEIRSNLMTEKAEIINKKLNLLQTKVLIDGHNITLETWLKDAQFEIWNNSNKISRIEVHYTSFGVMGMQIIYHMPTKAPEKIGIITNQESTIENVDFPNDEWLMQIQISNSNKDLNTPTFTLCDSISFYTNKNVSGSSPKVTIPKSSQNNAIQNKSYYVDNVSRTWLEHKANAEAQGAQLACFENTVERNKMYDQIGNARYGSYYIGLYHPNALIANNLNGGGRPYDVPSNKNSNWKWIDDTPYNPNGVDWNGGEPNNYGPGENVGQLYGNGKMNDLTKTYRLPAIYQKKIINTNTQTIRKSGQHIKSFAIKPELTATYDSITSTDILQRMNAEAAAKSNVGAIREIQESIKTLDNSVENINDSIKDTTNSIEHIKSKRNLYIKINNAGDKYKKNIAINGTLRDERQETAQVQPFANQSENFFSNYMSNTNMIEGFKEGIIGNTDFVDANWIAENETTRLTGTIQNDINTLRENEQNKAISEFVIKKDNIFTNVLTDYMASDDRENNFEGVYNKIDQQNSDKMRKIEINTYYDKAYKEYINILKIIIFACIILVPIVIANKNSMLPNTITNILLVSIIFLTIIYIITKFVDIYMRDNKDFDKIRIPYDREAAILQKAGTIDRKNSLLSSFALTCIGADCCPELSGGLVYDPVRNRCVANETFADYFDTPIGGYLDNTLNSYIDNSIDGIMGGSSQISIVEPYTPKPLNPQMDLESLVGASLRASDPTHMFSPRRNSTTLNT